MSNQEIRELLALFNESGVAEMEVQRGENRVRFRRAMSSDYVVPQAAPGVPMAVGPMAVIPAAIPAPGSPAGVGAVPAPVGASGSSPAATPPAATEKLDAVTAPIVGTFYESPSPGSAAFVRVGDNVEKGQVLCIIESMKLMNEIESEIAGTIMARLVENGKPVEYGQTLFTIRPR